MSKQVISLESRWHASGALAPFRDLASQLVRSPDDFTLPDGYNSLLQLLLQSESGSGRFVPAREDPCLPNSEAAYRIADGVANLLVALIQADCSFKISVHDATLDPWTRWCLQKLEKQGHSHSFALQVSSQSLREHDHIPGCPVRSRIASAARFGFVWDVPNVILRAPSVRGIDPQAAHNFLGHALYAYGRLSAAERRFDLALNGVDSHMRVSTLIGKINCRVRRGGKLIELVRLIATLAEGIEEINEPHVRRRFRTWLPNMRAFVMQREDLGAALSILEEGIALAETYNLPLHLGVFLKNKAVLLQRLGTAPIEVIPLYERAISLRPFDQDWYCDLGRLYVGLSNYERAAHYFREAYEPGLPTPNSLTGLAQCSLLEGCHDRGIRYRRQVAELRPQVAGLQVELGRRLDQSRVHGDSAPAFLEAWRLDPDWDLPAYELMRSLGLRSMPEYRIEILSILSRREQQLPINLHLLLGRFMYAQRDLEQAKNHLEEAVRADDPRIQFAAYFYLGDLMSELRGSDEANRYYEKCLTLVPRSSEVMARQAGLASKFSKGG